MPEANQTFQKRRTAYKIQISDILNSNYIKTEGVVPNYLEHNGEEISRLNLIGVIVDKSDLNNYITLTIDDGTGRISTRVFDGNLLLNKLNVCDIVLIIGRPREFSSEKYILIETIKKINASWAMVRNLEFKKISKNNIKPQNKNIKVEVGVKPIGEGIVSNNTDKVLKLIKDLDKGNGVPIEEISSKSFKDIDKMINLLIKEGNIFEVRPGILKILE